MMRIKLLISFITGNRMIYFGWYRIILAIFVFYSFFHMCWKSHIWIIFSFLNVSFKIYS
jgi:hypothetical protein